MAESNRTVNTVYKVWSINGSEFIVALILLGKRWYPSQKKKYIYIYSSKWLRLRTRQTDLNLSDECVGTKLRVTGNHACFILVILNCISLYTHVYWALSNSICYNFPQLYIYIYLANCSYKALNAKLIITNKTSLFCLWLR